MHVSISGVIARLKELGLTDWELQSSLQRVIYQRLIAGKGLLVCEKEKFEEWKPDEWNDQIDQLVADGFISAIAAAREKIEFSEAD